MADTITSKTLGGIAPYDPNKPTLPLGDSDPNQPISQSATGTGLLSSSTPAVQIPTPKDSVSPLTAPSDTTGIPTAIAPSTNALDLQAKSDTAAKTLTSTPPAYTPGADTTVEGRLTGLLADDSQYLQGAKAASQQAMNARGMLNSTMAGEAGQAAAIKAALPIATSDAQYMQARNLSDQAAAQKSLLETQQAGESAALTNVQGDVSSALSKQAAGQALTQQEQAAILDYNTKSKLSAESAAYNSALSKQQAGEKLTAQEAQAITDYQMETLRQTGANYRDKVDNDVKVQMNAMNINSTEKQAIAGTLSTVGQKFNDEVASVLASPVEWTLKNAMVQTLQTTYRNTVNSAMLPYGVSIDWAGYGTAAYNVFG